MMVGAVEDGAVEDVVDEPDVDPDARVLRDMSW
jgi:hypothetical protein